MRGEVNIWIKVKKEKHYQNGYGKTDCISKTSKPSNSVDLSHVALRKAHVITLLSRFLEKPLMYTLFNVQNVWTRG